MNVQMPGSEGMAEMQKVMAAFRSDPLPVVGGLAVERVRDYLDNVTLAVGGPAPAAKLEGPSGDMVILDTAEEGNYIACRPSGTEPKIKFYMFAYTPAEQLHDLDEAKRDLGKRLDAMEADLRNFAGV